MKFKNLEQLKAMNKKEFKSYINANGGFVKMSIDKLETNKAEIPKNFASKVPEDAIYFEGIASNGDINMNGYIIRPSAWKPAIKDYMNDFGGKIYYQHDMDNVIGQTLEAKVVGDELQVKGYVFDEYTGNRISKELSTDLSTGHYTLDWEYQNRKEEGKVIKKEEFEELKRKAARESEDREEYYEKLEKLYSEWVLAVTKLIWVEYSVVNVGSNKKSEITDTNTNNANVIFNMNAQGEDMKESIKQEFLSFKAETNDIDDTSDSKEIESDASNEVNSDGKSEVEPKKEESNDDKAEDEDEKEDNQPAREITLDDEEEEDEVEETTEDTEEDNKEEEESTEDDDSEKEQDEESDEDNKEDKEKEESDEEDADESQEDNNDSEEDDSDSDDGDDDSDDDSGSDDSSSDESNDSKENDAGTDNEDKETQDANDTDGEENSGNEDGNSEAAEEIENNDLGIKIETLKAKLADKDKEINTLKNAIAEADEIMAKAEELITNQQAKIDKLNVIVEKAKSVTIKNGVYTTHKKSEKSKLEQDMENAARNHFGH